jgi:hypothetical protein
MLIFFLVAVTFAVLAGRKIVFRLFSLKGITYKRFFDRERAFQGDEIAMVEVIENRKLLPLPWVRIESIIDPALKFFKYTDLRIRYGKYHYSFFNLGPYKRIRRTHHIRCTKRGYYESGIASLTCGDLFPSRDLFSQYPPDGKGILVYPLPARMSDIPMDCRKWIGDLIVRRWIVPDPFLIRGVRDYAPGDPMNRINWKTSAKQNALQVHTMDASADPRLLILLNINGSYDRYPPVMDTDAAEQGISTAATIASYILSRGMEAGIGVNCPGLPYLPPKSGSFQERSVLKLLARAEIEYQISFVKYLDDITADLKGISDLLIISPYTNPKIESIIRKSVLRSVSVKVLLI